ncbi:von Willebrand factor A domain-containing protein 5A [Oryzias melastigma]|uniref:von Willebrand factor A domain-containing protein 5A n=1 Tax=Oryzias melastigma TaxID=30732 RepID=UPI000CF7FFBC|nr:von Willebrand factor A domain-containing protein 5A [Oryzias melastigma]
MQAKVMQSLKFALQPVVKDISVTWDLPEGVSATVLSPPITTIFQGQRSLLYAQLRGKSSQTDCSVTVNYTLADHPYKNQMQFDLNPAKDTGLTVHRLAARSLIRSLEVEERENRGKSDEDVKKKVVELSVQSGVSSGHTAFIAVNKDSGDAVQGPLVRRDVPTPGFFQPMMAKYCSAPMHSGSYTPLRGVLQEKKVKSSAPQASKFKMTFPFKLFGRGVKDQRTHHSIEAVCSFSDEMLFSPLPRYEIRSSCLKPDYIGCLPNRASEPEPPRRDPLLQLVSLPKASGCWMLDAALASVLGKTSKELEKSKPKKVSSEVWATILALTWLHGFKMDAKDEWELLAVKAASWVQAQNAPCVKECVDAANALLGCRVQKEALGLRRRN